MKKSIIIIVIILLVINGINYSVTSIFQKKNYNINPLYFNSDFDPLIDISLFIEILSIRALDIIDKDSKPDFFLLLYVNGEEINSPIWENKVGEDIYWKVEIDVPDHKKFVDITFQLWDWNENYNIHCDLNSNINDKNLELDVDLLFDITTNKWFGGDYIGDKSGYGRLNGCDDGSIYKDENDCEILFNIYINDYDGDGLPYWIEKYVYGTDPKFSNIGDDMDNDGIPIEWEHIWGYNPILWDDHNHIDPDFDSITNYEEFLTSEYDSDPFRKDIFLEIDYMEDIIIINGNELSSEIFEILKLPFHRRNIVFHVDYGFYNGGEIITFDEHTTFDELLNIYNNYFLHNDEQKWKRSIFHYAIIVNHSKPNGFAFSGDVEPYWGYIPGTNGFILSNTLIDRKEKTFIYTKSREYLYASLLMHEMGHNFGIRFGNPFGCDNQLTKNPFLIGWWRWGNYKSCMNYRYTYKILDYSDGSHGKRDFDDWENIDLSYFENHLN